MLAWTLDRHRTSETCDDHLKIEGKWKCTFHFSLNLIISLVIALAAHQIILAPLVRKITDKHFTIIAVDPYCSHECEQWMECLSEILANYEKENVNWNFYAQQWWIVDSFVPPPFRHQQDAVKWSIVSPFTHSLIDQHRVDELYYFITLRINEYYCN